MPKYHKYAITEFGGINHTDAPDALTNGECLDALNLYSLEKGWLRGRLGSDYYAISETHFNYGASDVRLLTEYDTDKGTPAAGKPGLSAAGDKYLVIFTNTKSGVNTGGAITILKHDDFSWVTTFEVNNVLSTDGITYLARLLPETELIPKGVQAHGRCYLPLPANKLIVVWIENSVWHCEQLAIRLFDVDTVLIDARTAATQENNGAITSSLVLSPWVAPEGHAVKQTEAYTVGVGTYAQPIVNRADGKSGEPFLDVMQDPTRDLNRPLITIEQVKVDYAVRTSPVTGIGWQSATDIFYRPDNQVADFEKNKAPRDTIPESRYGYRFVWQFTDGTYSNPTSDLWVGDMLWSALGAANATDLHQTFATPVYGEKVSGAVAIALQGDVAIDATTCNVLDADGDKVPQWLITAYTGALVTLSDGTNTDWAWLTAIGAHGSGGAGKTQLTFSRGKTNHAFTVANTAKITVFFDQGSVANGAGTWSSFDHAGDTLTKLKALKKQLYAPTHAHYQDDAWLTVKFPEKATMGSSFQFDVGFFTPPTPAVVAIGMDNRNVFPTSYGLGDLWGPSGKVLRAAGWILDCQDSDITFRSFPGFEEHVATGVRNAYSGGVESVQAPNLTRIENDTDSVTAMLDQAGVAAPLLIMDGAIDYEFCRTPDNAQALRGVGIKYRATDGTLQTYNTPNTGTFYSFRFLLPAQRLLWDWQLSQTIPSSAIFLAPRIGLKILAANIPANAKQLLIFRTKNSLDPSFSPTDFGLVATVTKPTGDLYYFDNVKDTALLFTDSPQNYEGIKYGIAAQFAQLLGERLYLGNIIEYYKPQAPRAEIRNTDDTTPMNTSVVFEAWADTSNPFADPGSLATYKYLIIYRDVNGITSGYKICPLIDRRPGASYGPYVPGTGTFAVKGYFLGHGDETVTNLDVYRFVPGGAATDYILVATLTKDDGGVFRDDTKATTNVVATLDLSTFGVLQTVLNPSSVRWSEPARPEFIKGENLQDVAKGDGESVTGLDILHSNLYVFKQNSTHRILIDISSNTPEEERLETVSLKEGCIAPCTLLNNGALLFFLSELGLRAFDGTRWHQLDEKVYNDIQALCRATDVRNFTGVFVPRYGAYWLSINTAQNDLTTVSPSGFAGGVSSSLTVTVGDGAKLPTAGRFAFSIDDGIHQGTGQGRFVSGDTISNATVTPDVNYNAGATVTVYNTNAVVWVFDLFYAGGEVKPREGVVTRYQFVNQKMFLRRRDGRVISGVTRNPTFFNAGASVACVVLQEDGGASGATKNDGGVDANGGLAFQMDAGWDSPLLTAREPVRIKRTRYTRIRAQHDYSITRVLTPLTFIETAVNVGAVPANNVADTVTRYHRSPVVDVPYDDNVKFVCLDAMRGLDVKLHIAASVEDFILREIESDYNVRRQDE